MCLHESVECVASAGTEKEENDNVKTFLNMSSKRGGEILADLMKWRVQDQGSAPSFQRVYQSVSNCGLDAEGTRSKSEEVRGRENLCP